MSWVFPLRPNLHNFPANTQWCAVQKHGLYQGRRFPALHSVRGIRGISHLGHLTHHLGRGCQLCQDANAAATPLEWHLYPQRGSADALTKFHLKALLNLDEKDWVQVQTTCGFQFRPFHPEMLYTLKSHLRWVWREQKFSSVFQTNRAAYLSRNKINHIYKKPSAQ